jgi:hypothetical protein
MEERTRTLEQIQGTIKAARDSVWVINNEIEKLANGQQATTERKGNIERNVSHLKIIVAAEYIISSGEDISDLQAGIVAGEAKLAEPIWPETE